MRRRMERRRKSITFGTCYVIAAMEPRSVEYDNGDSMHALLLTDRLSSFLHAWPIDRLLGYLHENSVSLQQVACLRQVLSNIVPENLVYMDLFLASCLVI